jgi:PD-(D/E)XK nuclease superfamily
MTDMNKLPNNEPLNGNADKLLELASGSNPNLVEEANHAPNFNGFRLLNPNELGLSAVLANLLNPKGNHAQKELFLKKFLAHFMSEHENDPLANVEVKLESPIEGKRRIDLVITSGDFVLAFENKPWARDQDWQVCAYLDYLQNDAVEKKTKLLVYLSRDGSSPNDASIPKDNLDKAQTNNKLKIIAYLDLVKWLEDCEKKVTAANVKHFIAEYIAYIKFQFDADEKAIADKLVEHAAYVDAAFWVGIRPQEKSMPSNKDAASKVNAVLARFRLKRLEVLLGKIRCELATLNWQPGSSMDFDADFSFGQRLEISIPDRPNYVFSFAFKDRGISEELHWGIEWKDRCDPPPDLKGVAKEFTVELNELSENQASNCWLPGTSTWLCYAKFGNKKWNSAEPWQNILDDGSIAADMVKKIDDLYNLLKNNELFDRLKQPPPVKLLDLR